MSEQTPTAAKTLGYHSMASGGRCDWTHLREAVAEAVSGSRAHSKPFNESFYPGHQMVASINYNSLDRIVTAFVDAATPATCTPAPLVSNMMRALPGGGMDDSTFEAVEGALDRADVPCEKDGRFITLVERIQLLADRATASAEGALQEALIDLVDHADRMPKKTPAAGSCVTEHQFTIEAGTVWALDASVARARRLLASLPAGKGGA